MAETNQAPSHPPMVEGLAELSTEAPIWDRFFTLAPLVIVGTRETDGGDDVERKRAIQLPALCLSER